MEAEVLQECGEARSFTAVGRKHGDHLFEILEYRVEEGGGLLVLVRLGWPHFTQLQLRLQTKVYKDFTITEKTLTRVFSLMKVPTNTFTSNKVS